MERKEKNQIKGLCNPEAKLHRSHWPTCRRSTFVTVFFLPFYVFEGGRREKKNYQSVQEKFAVLLACFSRATRLARGRAHTWLCSEPLISALWGEPRRRDAAAGAQRCSSLSSSVSPRAPEPRTLRLSRRRRVPQPHGFAARLQRALVLLLMPSLGAICSKVEHPTLQQESKGSPRSPLPLGAQMEVVAWSFAARRTQS